MNLFLLQSQLNEKPYSEVQVSAIDPVLPQSQFDRLPAKKMPQYQIGGRINSWCLYR